MPTNNLNWINKIQVKSSKHASNNIGQNLSRKLTTAKCIFLPDLHMSINSEKIHAYRWWKFSVTVKYQLIRSYRIRTKNQTVHRPVLEWNLCIQNNNFIKPKGVKLGTLLKIPETKLKTNSLVTARGHKENQK